MRHYQRRRLCRVLRSTGRTGHSHSANWTSVEAATLPENLFTVYDNVVTRAALAGNETILIQGGSSGIGTMAIMLAKLFDATIIVSAGSDSKCQASTWVHITPLTTKPRPISPPR